MWTEIILNDVEPVATGSEREIFIHPDDQHKLIKVLLPEHRQRIGNKFRRISQHLFPFVRTAAVRKEVAVFAGAMMAPAALSNRLPISHIYGFVRTDIGVGLVVDRVRGSNAPLGATLSKLANAGQFNDHHLELLNDTIRRIDLLNLRTSDLNPNNFVFGRRAGGVDECVLVDGTGDTHAIPIRSLSNFTNRLANSIEYKRWAHKLGLIWDAKPYQYKMARSAGDSSQPSV